jgi:hypothetical protein
MHGIEHCTQKCERFACPLPGYRFLRLPIHRVQTRPLRSEWDRSLATAFRSPVTIPAFTGSIPGSTFPAYRFASLLAASAVRSALPLRHPMSGSPRIRSPQCIEPVTASTTRFAHSASGFHSPSGFFPSLRIKAFNQICREPARLPNPHDFLSLPATVGCLRCSATDHRSWFVTSSEACCSSNLLEPLTLCARFAFLVN